MAAVLALWVGRPAAAAEPPKRVETPQLSQAAAAGWFRTTIISGRIVVQGRRFGSTITQSRGEGPDEEFTIRMAGAVPSISYKISSTEGEFSLSISSGDRISIRQVPGDNSALPQMEFRQSAADEGISLIVGRGGDQKTYAAKTLWHLLIGEAEVCSEHLLPLLEPLLGRHDLGALADQVVTVLVRNNTAAQKPERETWAKLVEQLGDDRFGRREAADRQLRAAGPRVVAFLAGLDRAGLDAEQHYRVARIIRAFSDQGGQDTPELAASWLAADPEIWLALLARDKESTRRLATQQLEVLLGATIDFDPAADEKTRKAQIEQLRLRIVKQ